MGKMSADVKISVVTVCFNSVKTVEQAIKSVISQGHKNIEYIIIDGGSTDGTLDIIKKYEQYISYWVSEPDHGIYDAMNKGIKVATGDLIAFLNSDDWYFVDALERVAQMYATTRGNVIYGDMAVADSSGKDLKLLSCKDADFSRILYETVVYHPCTFIETRILKKRLFDTKYRICSDDDLFIDLYLKKHSFVYVGEGGITHFRLGGCSSSTTNSLKTNREVYIIGKKYLRYYRGQAIYHKIKRKLRNIIGYVFLLTIENKLHSSYKEKLRKAALSNRIKKVVIFGAGTVGRILAQLCLELKIDFEIADNNSSLKNSLICGKKVVAVDSLKVVDGTVVLLANSGISEVMVKQLTDMGFARNINFYDFHEWCMYLLAIRYGIID